MEGTSSASRQFRMSPEAASSIAVVSPALLLGAFATVVIGCSVESAWAGLFGAYQIAGLASFGPLAIALAKLDASLALLGPALGWLFLLALVAIARMSRLRTKPVVSGLFMWVWTFVGCLALMALAA